MGEKSYRIKNKYVVFSEDDEEFECLCIFPHNYEFDGIDIETVQSLALFGAAVRLIYAGHYEDDPKSYIVIPDDIPDWIVDGIRKIGE